MFRSLGSALLFLLVASQSLAQEGIQLKRPDANKPKDSISYMLGWDCGMLLMQNGISATDLSKEEVISGILDALAKEKCKLDESELESAKQALGTRLMKRFDDMVKANSEQAEKFLEENKKKDGIIALPSGIQYKVLKAGSGAKPTLSSIIKVHYEGKTLDGNIFDSSLQRNIPAEFQLTRMIEGWREVVPKMKVGDKWTIFVPPALGYGLKPPPQSGIMPNSLLVFEIELLDVKEP